LLSGSKPHGDLAEDAFISCSVMAMAARTIAFAFGVIVLLDGSVSNFVCGASFDHHAAKNLSSNMMANWVLASHHSRGGIFHFPATWRKTRYNNFIVSVM